MHHKQKREVDSLLFWCVLFLDTFFWCGALMLAAFSVLHSKMLIVFTLPRLSPNVGVLDPPDRNMQLSSLCFWKV